MSTRISNIILCAVIAVTLGLGCVPIDTGDAGDSSSFDDVPNGSETTAGDSGAADAGPDVPVSLRAEDQCDYDDKSGSCSFFDGELVLNFAPDALGGPLVITVTRDTLRVGGVSLVGYVWGPHGQPIDPAAEVVVTIPRDYVESDQISLSSWNDPDEPKPLANQTLQNPGDGTFILKGEMAVFETILITSP